MKKTAYCQSFKEMMSCILTLIYLCMRLYLKCIIRVSVLHVLQEWCNARPETQLGRCLLGWWLDGEKISNFVWVQFKEKKNRKTTVSLKWNLMVRILNFYYVADCIVLTIISLFIRLMVSPKVKMVFKFRTFVVPLSEFDPIHVKLWNCFIRNTCSFYVELQYWKSFLERSWKS